MSGPENERECTDSMNVSRDMNTNLLGATPHAGDGTGVTGSLRKTGSCHFIERTVGGTTSAA